MPDYIEGDLTGAFSSRKQAKRVEQGNYVTCRRL
jgi:hypothetical protein